MLVLIFAALMALGFALGEKSLLVVQITRHGARGPMFN